MKSIIPHISVKFILSFYTIIMLGILFLFPSQTFSGAKAGLLLWFQVVLPTLLPFLIISDLIINLRLTTTLSNVCYPILHTLFGISHHACYPTLIGLLTGLPVGAKASADLVKQHRLSKNEAQYVITFCNNLSPMFVISYISISTLQLPQYKYLFLAIIFCSSIFTGFIYRMFHLKELSSSNLLLTDNNDSVCNEPLRQKVTFSIVDQAIFRGFETITKIGGYIILFSILTYIFQSLSFGSSLWNAFSIGTIEITNGANYIANSSLSLPQKIALIIPLTTFGGLSSIAQTKSVIDDSGLSIKKYIWYKIINAGVTFLFILSFLTMCNIK